MTFLWKYITGIISDTKSDLENTASEDLIFTNDEQYIILILT